MSYRRRASPLHAARAGAGCAYCLALACAALMLDNPIVLAAVVVAVLGAGVGAGVGRELRRAALLALPLALRDRRQRARHPRRPDGDRAARGPAGARAHRHHARGDRLRRDPRPARARPDPGGALYTVAVDPDEVLRLFRRVSFRSALTATLATRMVPVLVRDSRRLADAQRCRPGPPPSRVALMRAAQLRRARPRARRRRGARGARVRLGAAPAAGAGAVSAPRPRVRRRAVAILALAIGARIGRRPRSTRTRRCTASGGAAVMAVAGAIVVRAGAVRRPQGDRAVSVLSSIASATATRAPRARAGRRLARAVAGELVVVAGASGSGKSTLLRAASGLVPHFHGGAFAGRVTVAGMDTRATARRARGRRGHAVPGSRDPDRDGDGARRACVPAREPGRARRRDRARRRGGGARARDRGSCSSGRPTSCREASSSGSRSAPRSPGVRSWSCSTSRRRSSIPSPATS